MPPKNEKTETQTAAEAKDPQVNLSPGDREPANIAQQGAPTTDTTIGGTNPQVEGSVAGDLNAGEGNAALGGGEVTSTSNSAGARSQTGPEQSAINQDNLNDVDRTEDPMALAMVGDQDKAAVEGRVADELGNLAADQSLDDTFRTATNEVAYAPPGTKNASNMGVQQDASGHFESVAHTRSTASGTRV